MLEEGAEEEGGGGGSEAEEFCGEESGAVVKW